MDNQSTEGRPINDIVRGFDIDRVYSNIDKFSDNISDIKTEIAVIKHRIETLVSDINDLKKDNKTIFRKLPWILLGVVLASVSGIPNYLLKLIDYFIKIK